MARRDRSASVVPPGGSLVKMLGFAPGKPARKKHDWAGRIEASLGYRLGAELRSFVTWAGNRPGEHWFGYVHYASEWPAAVADSKKWLTGLLGTTIAPLIEAFTETVWVGTDISGNMFFANADPRCSEVWFYDHDGSGMFFLAGSLTEFVRLQQLVQCWAKWESSSGREFEELTRAGFASPPLSELGAALRGLDLCVPVDRVASTDFDDLVPALARKKFRGKSCAPRTGALYARGEWLCYLLFMDIVADLSAVKRRNFAREIKDPKLGALRATKLYWLWHLYLFGRDEELSSYGRSLEKDRSELVRRTATMLQEVGSSKRAEFDKVRHLRERVQDELADPRGVQRARKEKRATAGRLDAFLDAPNGTATDFKQALEWFAEDHKRCRSEKARFEKFLAKMREHPEYAKANFHELFSLAEENERFHAGRLALFRSILALPIPKAGRQRDSWLRAANNAIIAAQEAKQLEAGREVYEAAERHAGENPYIFHSAACVFALLGDVRKTEAIVRLAVRYEYENLDQLAVDRDILPLIGKKRLAALVDEA